MAEPLTVRVRWSAEVEAVATERFLQPVSRVRRCIRYIEVAFFLIVISLDVYFVVRGRVPWVCGCCMLLVYVPWPIYESVMRSRHPRAMAADRRDRAEQGYEAEWTFTPDEIEHRMGHSPLWFKWKRCHVTRFPDGFVLDFPDVWIKYWLPASAFPDSAVDEFEKLAQKAAAKYRTASAGAV